MPSTTAPATYTVDEVAALLGVNRMTLYGLIRRDDTPFPVVRIGRLIKVPRAAIDRMLQGADQ